MDRPAELEHHVVGHVDGERDRALPAEQQPARHPGRRGRGRVETAHRPGHEDGTTLRVVDHDRVADLVGRRGLPVGGIVEGHVVRKSRLAGDTAERERVGPVRVDLELDHLVAQVQQVEDVVARLARVGGQHQDACVVLAEPELLGGADHAGGEVAVGLACGDLEASGQHPAGEYDHQVAGREVVRAADDALGLTGAVGIANVDGAPVDGLAVLLRLRLHREHTADHQRAGDVVAGSLDRLELQAERRQPGRDVLGGDLGGQVGVLPDPGEWGPSQLTPERSGEAHVPLERRACPRPHDGTSGCGRCPSQTRSR